MTFKDMVEEVSHLTVEERRALIRILYQSLDQRAAEAEPHPEYPASILALRGFLKPEGEMPTDEALQDDYVRHLLEKYA